MTTVQPDAGGVPQVHKMVDRQRTRTQPRRPLRCGRTSEPRLIC